MDERYGRTPKAQLQRQSVSFTELYRRGAVADGMLFHMTYDGDSYQARTVLAKDGVSCYFQVLDEEGRPFVKNGQVLVSMKIRLRRGWMSSTCAGKSVGPPGV